MTGFTSAFATAPDWKTLLSDVGAQLEAQSPDSAAPGALGFVYVTEALAPHFSDIVLSLRARTGVSHWAGCVASGVCGSTAAGASGEFHDEPALAVLLTRWAEDDIHVFESITKPEDIESALANPWGQTHGPGAESGSGPVFGLVHGDPRNHLVHEIVTALPTTGDGYFIGGLTSLADTPVQVADQPTGGGLSGVLLSATVPVMVTHSQGCSPVGPMHRITSGDRSFVAGLDDRPALDVLKEDIGEVLARDLNRIGGYIHVAMPVPGSDTGDYTVRNLVGLDPNGGVLAIGDEIHMGDRMMFVRRDPETARRDFEEKLTDLKARIGGQTIRGGVFVSCVARGQAMFGEAGQEVRLIHDILGHFPLTGFYANGEICGNRMYGYTGVLSVFL